ncbi:MAG: hypothetical protein L0H96_21675 [Humibacillus sp.]|nr:hypothetical protein [Humibacillus sp.]MDN5779507.1 hypothetical protein [Humibacillus sp.]
MPTDLRIRTRRGGLGIAVVASIALIGPAACSAEGDSAEAPSPSTTVSTSAPTPNEPPATSTAGPSASEQPTSGGATDVAGAGNKQALLAAGATAEKAVSGSTLISIELESDGWEAQVVTADGVEHEMTVATDGRTVTSGPTKDDEDAADRAKHRQRLADSSVDYRQAVEAVSAAVPKGTIRELDLDTWKGKVVWEADVIDGSGTKREVKVDGSSGTVVLNQIDR